MFELLHANRKSIEALCCRYGVARLDVFGSALRDDFRPGEGEARAQTGGRDPITQVESWRSVRLCGARREFRQRYSWNLSAPDRAVPAGKRAPVSPLGNRQASIGMSGAWLCDDSLLPRQAVRAPSTKVPQARRV